MGAFDSRAFDVNAFSELAFSFTQGQEERALGVPLYSHICNNPITVSLGFGDIVLQAGKVHGEDITYRTRLNGC